MMGVIGVSLAGVVRPPMLKPRGELLLEVAGVVPEALDALGLVLQNVERCDAGGGDGRWMRSGEEEWARAVVEVVDEVARCRRRSRPRAPMAFDSVPTCTSTSLRAVEVIDTAATVAAQHSGRVRVVDHHDRAVFFGECAQLVDGADVAIHREDAVGDDELVAGLVLRLLCSSSSQWATSLWRKTLILARDSRAPSMMLA